ncbi:MAG: hypothetical protein KDD25_10270, partial [Bdellovibrionales bacterium]|nr:hypothetical protein [Bdellovibrionales bacterium]
MKKSLLKTYFVLILIAFAAVTALPFFGFEFSIHNFNSRSPASLEAVGENCRDCDKSPTSAKAAELERLALESCVPANVLATRRLMALTYQTCDAVGTEVCSGAGDKRECHVERTLYSKYDEGSKKALPLGYDYIDYKVGKEVRTCDSSKPGEICRDIVTVRSPLQVSSEKRSGIRDTHFYNSMPDSLQCSGLPKCKVNAFFGKTDSKGEEVRESREESCLGLFQMITGSTADFKGERPEGMPLNYSDRMPYRQERNGEIDLYRNLSLDNNGSQFLGWSCSEFVTTALALAGMRVTPKVDVKNRDYNTTMYRNPSVSSCFETLDLAKSGTDLKAGDLIVFDGHMMMVDSVSALGALSDRLLHPKSISDCDEDKIDFSDVNFTVAQSAAMHSGVGPMAIDMGTYQQISYRTDLIGSLNIWSQSKNIERICESDFIRLLYPERAYVETTDGEVNWAKSENLCISETDTEMKKLIQEASEMYSRVFYDSSLEVELNPKIKKN